VVTYGTALVRDCVLVTGTLVLTMGYILIKILLRKILRRTSSIFLEDQ
jgi:hypothetical protein